MLSRQKCPQRHIVRAVPVRRQILARTIRVLGMEYELEVWKWTEPKGGGRRAGFIGKTSFRHLKSKRNPYRTLPEWTCNCIRWEQVTVSINYRTWSTDLLLNFLGQLRSFSTKPWIIPVWRPISPPPGSPREKCTQGRGPISFPEAVGRTLWASYIIAFPQWWISQSVLRTRVNGYRWRCIKLKGNNE